MKAKEIQELISFISESALEEVNIETDEIKLSIKRSSRDQIISPSVQTAVPEVVLASTPRPLVATSTPNDKSSNQESQTGHNLIEIKSPMIGTFYRSSNPESASFVEVGSTIKIGDTVCIIEAMKLFNEIESETSGKIMKVLVDNAQPVEYDQPLFLIDPS